MQNYIYDLCKQHMNQHVMLHTTAGEQIQGVITNVDDENVYVSIPTRSDNVEEDSRQYNPYGGGPQYPPRPRPRPPYGPGGPYSPGPRPRPPYGGYPPHGPGYPPYYGPGYGPQPQPGSGANRLIIPLAALAAISVLPFI